MSAIPKTVKAPIRGLNYKDSLATMKDGDALVLDNIVCRPAWVEVRPGWQPHATGFAATVETLMPYNALDGTRKLFAAAGANIYDASAAGAIGAAVVTGATSAYWSYTVLSNIGGNTLLAVNGVSAGQLYNGTTWAAWSITGVANTALDFVTVWKRRVWAIEKNTFRAWYLATDAVTGAMTSFSFQTVFQKGGKLVALLNWTIDGGTGVDDILVAVTSEGEVALYVGTDPASAATFSLQGVYYLGKPVGRRFFAKFGGDIFFLTTSGIVPLSRFLQSPHLEQTTIISDRIQQKLMDDVAAYASVQGWEVVVYFEDNILLIQVPGGAVGSRYQYCMNTLTGAWSRLVLNQAVTFATYDSLLYAGHATQVVNTWTGGIDNAEPITYRVIPAFSSFGAPTQGKLMLLARVTFEADNQPTFQTQLLRNYNVSCNFPSQVPGPASGALWGTAIWGTDIWGGASDFYRSWFSVSGYSSAVAMAVEGVSNGDITRIIVYDYVYEVGGIFE